MLALAAAPPPGRLERGEDGVLEAADASQPGEWTLDALTEAARAAGIRIARSQVRRIFLAERVRWRRTRTWTAGSMTGAPTLCLFAEFIRHVFRRCFV